MLICSDINNDIYNTGIDNNDDNNNTKKMTRVVRRRSISHKSLKQNKKSMVVKHYHQILVIERYDNNVKIFNAWLLWLHRI